MHGKDHGGGRAGAAERVAQVGDVEDRGAEAAERDGNLCAQQLVLARGVDRSVRKTRFSVDLFGIRGGDRSNSSHAFLERRAALEADTIWDTKAGFLDVYVHDRHDLRSLIG